MTLRASSMMSNMSAGSFPNGISAGKTVAPSSAPGTGIAQLYWVAGTTAGTAKLIAYAGTSLTPVVIADNVGASF